MAEGIRFICENVGFHYGIKFDACKSAIKTNCTVSATHGHKSGLQIK